MLLTFSKLKNNNNPVSTYVKFNTSEHVILSSPKTWTQKCSEPRAVPEQYTMGMSVMGEGLWRQIQSGFQTTLDVEFDVMSVLGPF